VERLRYVKNPDTGKRVSRLNAPSEWMTREVRITGIFDQSFYANGASGGLGAG